MNWGSIKADIRSLFKKRLWRVIFIFIGAGSILLILISLSLTFGAYSETRRLESRVSSNPEWQKMYDYAKEGQKNLVTGKSDEELYMAAAFRWKSLGDATGEREFYLRSLEIYNEAIQRTDFGRYILTLNAGNVARLLGDFELADKYYLSAMQLNPGEAGTYLTRAEMLKNNLKADREDIKNFYKQSLEVLIGREYLRLASDYAGYLKEIGDLNLALDQYKLLRTVIPNDRSYAEAIEEIENLLKQK